MDRVLPSTLEMVLLYEDIARYEPRELVTLINQVSAPYSRNFSWVPSENTDQVLQFTADKIGVEVVHADYALSEEGFERALSSRRTRQLFSGAESAVQRHKKHVYVTVGLLADPNQNGEAPAFAETQFEFALLLIKMIGMMYMSRMNPLAVHWIQSDKLLTARQFAEISLDEKDISLLVHPVLQVADDGSENGEVLNGFRTIGASILIGREIVFANTPVDADQLVERAMQFVMKVRETGLMIPDGESFGSDESESIRVRMKDDELDPAGIIELTYERSDAHGFDFSPEVDEEDAEVEKIDDEDPVEKALKEKIAELKAREGANLFRMDAQEQGEDGENEVPQKAVEPWMGVSRRNDISALRELARGATAQDAHSADNDAQNGAENATGPDATVELEAPGIETPEADGKKSAGLMGKVTGMFGKRRA